jgi:hypothetical protein
MSLLAHLFQSVKLNFVWSTVHMTCVNMLFIKDLINNSNICI